MDEFYGNTCNCWECNGIVHTIRRGDTLYLLSRYYNVSIEDIMRANSSLNVYNLQVGDQICIPVGRPEMPMRPGNPMRPGMPMQPEMPMRPGMPMQPEMPMRPGNPMRPEMPMRPNMNQGISGRPSTIQPRIEDEEE